MNFKDFPRTFFVLFSDGDTFYFTVTATKEIKCPRLKNIYESNKNIEMPSTSILEFIYFFSMYFSVVGNIFCIKNTAFFPNTFPKTKLYTGLFPLFTFLMS